MFENKKFEFAFAGQERKFGPTKISRYTVLHKVLSRKFTKLTFFLKLTQQAIIFAGDNVGLVHVDLGSQVLVASNLYTGLQVARH